MISSRIRNFFKRVKAVYDKKMTLKLNVEQNTFWTRNIKMFTRNGANLSPEKKQELRELDKKLAALSLNFGENVLGRNQ